MVERSHPPAEGAEDVTSYVDEARQALRLADPADGASWRQTYEVGLRAAYQRKDFEGLASIAIFGAACLHEQGFFRETVEQLEFAATMARRDTAATAYVLSLRALYEALIGDTARAFQTLELAAEAAGVTDNLRGRLAFETYQSCVRSISLDAASLEELAAPIPEADAAGFDWMSSALRCWFVPHQVARGNWRASQPWTESLRLQAEVVNHPARLVDALTFELAYHVIRGEPTDDDALASLVEDATRTTNRIALARALGVALRSAVLRADAQGTTDTLERLEATIAALDPAFGDGVSGYRSLVEAYQRGAVDHLAPPQHLTLVNLGAMFAGMEAVAIGGSQVDAAEWQRWAEHHLPAHVETAIEWPVARDRVLGLLNVRAGSIPAGATLLRRAIRWADERGYAAEAAMSRLQLGELLSHGEMRSQRANEQRVARRQGWADLEALGIAPVAHAYAATRALALSRDDHQTTRLTPREARVISLLARGMTYRQIGDELQISWRTAQLHANHIYSKLGASGKMQAVEIARELNILTTAD